MIRKKLILKLMLSMLLVTAFSSIGVADTIDSGSMFVNLNSYTTPADAFTITPFDTTLGTLNSVTMGVILHVDGSAQLWTWGESSTITYNATNTLDAVSEMGWGPTVATLTGSEIHYNDNYDWDESFAGMWPTLNGTPANASNMITSNFGRFVGASPFDINVNLAGSASSTYQTVQPLDYSGNPIYDWFGNPAYDTVIFGYDGTAQMFYSYDYTPAPVPEPTTMLLLGLGLMGLVGMRKRFER